MGLISCPGCGRTISDKAEKCLQCGMTLIPQPLSVSGPQSMTSIPNPMQSTSPLRNSSTQAAAVKRRSIPTLLWILGGIFLLFVLVGVAGITGYFLLLDDPISTVKEGVLKYDESVTVGNAFDGYQYFKETKWKEFKTSQNRRVVEFEGLMDYERYVGAEVLGASLSPEQVMNAKNYMKSMKYSFVVQFALSQDNESFQIHYTGFKMSGTHLETGKSYEAEKDYDQGILLDTIYNNKPDPAFWTVLLQASEAALRDQ